MARAKTQLEITPVGELAVCCAPLGASELSDAEAGSMAVAFKALGDPARIQILDALARAGTQEICACDFVDVVFKSQPTVSHHLKILREAGLVEGERRGTWVWYRIVPERFEQLRLALDLPAR